MSVILLLIPLSVVIATAFLAAFIWAVRSGQYEDTCTPSMRLLTDDRARSAGWHPAVSQAGSLQAGVKPIAGETPCAAPKKSSTNKSFIQQ